MKGPNCWAQATLAHASESDIQQSCSLVSHSSPPYESSASCDQSSASEGVMMLESQSRSVRAIRKA